MFYGTPKDQKIFFRLQWVTSWLNYFKICKIGQKTKSFDRINQYLRKKTNFEKMLNAKVDGTCILMHGTNMSLGPQRVNKKLSHFLQRCFFFIISIQYNAVQLLRKCFRNMIKRGIVYLKTASCSTVEFDCTRSGRVLPIAAVKIRSILSPMSRSPVDAVYHPFSSGDYIQRRCVQSEPLTVA